MVIIILTREGEGQGDECGIRRITFGVIVKVILHYLRNTSSPWIRRYWDGVSVVYFSHTNGNLHSLPVLFMVLWFWTCSYATVQ